MKKLLLASAVILGVGAFSATDASAWWGGGPWGGGPWDGSGWGDGNFSMNFSGRGNGYGYGNPYYGGYGPYGWGGYPGYGYGGPWGGYGGPWGGYPGYGYGGPWGGHGYGPGWGAAPAAPAQAPATK